MSLFTSILRREELGTHAGAEGPAQHQRTPSKREAERAMREDGPDAAYRQARTAWFEATGAAVVQRSRFFVLLVLALLVIAVMALAIVRMMPLKTVEPWVIRVDEVRGNVEAVKGAAMRAENYQPARPVVERELHEFVKALWSINGDYPTLTKESQEAAYVRTRGRATQEFRDFVKAEGIFARIKSEPGLTRVIEPKTVTFRAEEGVAMVRFSTVERSSVAPAARRREWLMLLQYRLEPQSQPEEIARNPLGLYVFHFEISEER